MSGIADAIVKAAEIVADAIHHHAHATEMLARANAGEFDKEEDDWMPAITDMAGRPVKAR